MPPPQRLLTRILNLQEFLEIQELLPEAWLTAFEGDFSKQCHNDKKEEAPSHK